MEQHLYLALCTENGGVWHCVLKDGGLIFREFTALPCPMYLTFEPDTEKGSVGRLYILLRQPWAENGVFDSGIVTCSVAEDGSLGVPGEPESTHGLVGCHLCSWKGRRYAANYTSGSLARVPDLLVQHEGHGVDPARQEKAHTHYIAPTPDGKYLAVCDLGLDKIFLYDENLSPVSDVSVPAGNGPRHLAFSPDGTHAYCACELSSTLLTFTYADGKLTQTGEVSTLPDGFSGKSYPAAVRCTGDRVYVSNRGHDSIAVFSVRGDSVKRENVFSCGGTYPRDFDVYGDTVVVTNETSDSVSVFSLDGDKAEMTALYAGLGKPLCALGLLL